MDEGSNSDEIYAEQSRNGSNKKAESFESPLQKVLINGSSFTFLGLDEASGSLFCHQVNFITSSYRNFDY